MELLVVDQSTTSATEELLRSQFIDERLRYVRSCAVGKGAALNEGLMRAASEAVVCIDDDCEVGHGWIDGMAETLRSQPEVGAVFSSVVPGPFDPTKGYTPSRVWSQDTVLRSVGDARSGLGLGAGMALRRDAVIVLGGMDELLGPGGRYPSCDDWDIELRLLLRGWLVVHSATLKVVHHGFRTFADGREHTRRDWVAIGATFAKMSKSGRAQPIYLAMRIVSKDAIMPLLVDAARTRRPSGVIRLTAFCRGFVLGLLAPVDRATMRFKPR
jgi:GT2 family glycosyltransferase